METDSLFESSVRPNGTPVMPILSFNFLTKTRPTTIVGLVLVVKEGKMKRGWILVPQESILVAQESILVPQEAILVRQESILIDFSWCFQRFWAGTAAGTAAGKSRHNPAQNPAQRARPPRGGFRSPFFHLKNPIAKH